MTGLFLYFCDSQIQSQPVRKPLVTVQVACVTSGAAAETRELRELQPLRLWRKFCGRAAPASWTLKKPDWDEISRPRYLFLPYEPCSSVTNVVFVFVLFFSTDLWDGCEALIRSGSVDSILHKVLNQSPVPPRPWKKSTSLVVRWRKHEVRVVSFALATACLRRRCCGLTCQRSARMCFYSTLVVVTVLDEPSGTGLLLYTVYTNNSTSRFVKVHWKSHNN